MKIGLTFCLLLGATCLSTGCVWRSAYYDPETGIVHGGRFDSFHRRWLDNMREDLREYRCNSCNQSMSCETGGCDDCSSHGTSCGCGNNAPSIQRRSRHYGSANWSSRHGMSSYDPYEVYDDGEYVGDEYVDGEFVDGEYFGDYVDEGEVIHAPTRRSVRHSDDCPHCRKQSSHSHPRPQAHFEQSHPSEQYTEREGWHEVSPEEYQNTATPAPRTNRETSSAPPVSIDAGAMTTIPQRNPPPEETPASRTQSHPSSEESSSRQPSSSQPQWSPPQSNSSGRSFNDASSMKWAPSRL
ncbi:MAG: hypothetical protein O2955_15280 [Planctomycetota bacterium]|nr:hypothetical protein [Planctomycetota bacterium]MDA1213876.1 hypothetical protein [Planctomycetota bacterium]